jgi:hypothetical protein
MEVKIAPATGNIVQRLQQGVPPRMRSSIACWRCRRSKVKCLNNGVNTPCRACTTANRECTYPSPTAGHRSHRREDRTGAGADVMSFDVSGFELSGLVLMR